MDILETERLEMEGWTFDDGPDLFRIASNPNVGPAAGWKPHESLQESIEVINTVFFSNIVWKIIEKKSGRLIGCIGLEADKKRPDTACKELGYWLSESFWGKGIMTEAAEEVIKYAFEKLGLSMISICTSPANKRSQKVIDRLGFTYEGTLRKAFAVYDGTIRDIRCYSMLRKEWQQK